MIVAKELWAAALSELGREQDWANFKNEVARYQGDADPWYVQALHDVWSVMYGLQRKTTSAKGPALEHRR